ncbi:hypothetical protein ACJZ2D_011030 [Fusarium nematophilum]
MSGLSLAPPCNPRALRLAIQLDKVNTHQDPGIEQIHGQWPLEAQGIYVPPELNQELDHPARHVPAASLGALVRVLVGISHAGMPAEPDKVPDVSLWRAEDVVGGLARVEVGVVLAEGVLHAGNLQEGVHTGPVVAAPEAGECVIVKTTVAVRFGVGSVKGRYFGRVLSSRGLDGDSSMLA